MEDKLKDVHQSHGMTHGEYDELRLKQETGDVETVEPNSIGTVTDQYFKKDFADYKVPYHEVGFYHVAQEARSFNPASGERLSTPMVQKYSIHNFKEMLLNKGFTGYTTAIIHDPTKEKTLKEVPPFRHGETDPGKQAALDQALVDLANKEAALAQREQELNDREAALLAKQEDEEAEKNKLAAQDETEQIITSLPGKTIAELKDFAEKNQIDLSGATVKADLIAKISEALKPTPQPNQPV